MFQYYIYKVSWKLMIKKKIAVIFDMDGVLLNNTKYHIKAWEKFCKKHDITWDEEVYLKNINGRPIREGIVSLFPGNLSPDNIDSLCLEKEFMYREIYRNDIMPLPGLLPFLEHLSANNIPKAIATSANALNVAFTIEGINIKRYFNIVLDENSVTKGKPHPEIYLKTSKALNVDPSLCVVFEDSLSGITAARTAGMKVVGLTTTHAYDKLTDANMIKENFNKITIKTLESLFI